VKQLKDKGIDYRSLGREEFGEARLAVESGSGGTITRR